MKVHFTSEEIAVIFTNMTIMRKNIRKGLKKTYKDDWKEKVDCYESIVEMIHQHIDKSKNKVIDIEFNNYQCIMFYSFISWYVKKLNETMNKKRKLNKEEIKIMSILENVNIRLKGMVS